MFCASYGDLFAGAWPLWGFSGTGAEGEALLLQALVHFPEVTVAAGHHRKPRLTIRHPHRFAGTPFWSNLLRAGLSGELAAAQPRMARLQVGLHPEGGIDLDLSEMAIADRILLLGQIYKSLRSDGEHPEVNICTEPVAPVLVVLGSTPYDRISAAGATSWVSTLRRQLPRISAPITEVGMPGSTHIWGSNLWSIRQVRQAVASLLRKAGITTETADESGRFNIIVDEPSPLGADDCFRPLLAGRRHRQLPLEPFTSRRSFSKQDLEDQLRWGMDRIASWQSGQLVFACAQVDDLLDESLPADRVIYKEIISTLLEQILLIRLWNALRPQEAPALIWRNRTDIQTILGYCLPSRDLESQEIAQVIRNLEHWLAHDEDALQRVRPWVIENAD